MAERGKKLGARTRNHIRATVRMFLGWCARKDYLPLNHRLFDADSMAREIVDTEETDFYRPEELRVMLDAADESLRPIIALCALAGLRLQETLRLTWKDVFGSPGHITITATKSKTRQRRLVEIGTSLAEWLRPFNAKDGPLWPAHRDTFHAKFTELREGCRVSANTGTGDGRKIPVRKNGLRHGLAITWIA
jgi:integrase